MLGNFIAESIGLENTITSFDLEIRDLLRYRKEVAFLFTRALEAQAHDTKDTGAGRDD